MLKAFKVLIAVLVLIVNSACATMFNGSSTSVSIRSEDPKAKLYLNDTYIGQGGATVSVPKKGNHSIRATKEGCGDGTTAVQKKFDPTSLLGLLIDFGIVSMLIVDGAATGAISDIEPKNYVVNPNCG
jgi:hypothetical protein